jgi:thiol-disulfide isomerase/thioredoxin
MLQMKRYLLLLLIFTTSVVAKAQLAVGSYAPEITLPNNLDSIVSLSSLKGKVVLVDFWASWCVPCRASNPEVLKIYKKYAAQGFEVFAVSIDVKKEAWLKAIKQDKLTYMQVVDNTGWNSKIAGRYFVDEIPVSFLLDKLGRIVAVNLEGKGLEKKIKQLLQ